MHSLFAMTYVKGSRLPALKVKLSGLEEEQVKFHLLLVQTIGLSGVWNLKI